MNSLNKRMHRCSMWLALALALALVSSSVLAGPADDRARGRDDRGQAGRSFSHQSAADRQQQLNAQRNAAQRGGEGQRPPRLSPEERRQLRSDIRDAGREIYPQRR